MPKTLLVVDDSATMRKVFEMTFAGEDVTVVTHDGGDSLLARARDAKPALAIVDVLLGGANGYDVARALKGDASLGGLPVVMLYSEHTPLDEGRARDAGADGSLLKPFDTQAAIDKVRQFLQQPSAPVAQTTVSPAPVGMTRAMPGTAPPMGAAAQASSGAPRSPASAGIGSVGAQPPAASRPKATQMFASSPLASPPGPAMPPGPPPGPPARPPVGVVPPMRPAAPPVSTQRQPPAAPDIEIEVDGGDEELTLDPPTPVAPMASPARPPMPAVSSSPVAPRMAPPGPPMTSAQPVSSAHSAPPASSAHGAPSSIASAVTNAALNAEVSQRAAALGLTPAQVDAVTALTREVVERVVWEVVPQLAETLIREEIRRLTAE